MPATLTLKNIPDKVYKRMKASAVAHRRSLNSEILVCLEHTFTPVKVSPRERLERLRLLRESLGPVTFHAADIDAFKKEGRP